MEWGELFTYVERQLKSRSAALSALQIPWTIIVFRGCLKHFLKKQKKKQELFDNRWIRGPVRPQAEHDLIRMADIRAPARRGELIISQPVMLPFFPSSFSSRSVQLIKHSRTHQRRHVWIRVWVSSSQTVKIDSNPIVSKLGIQQLCENMAYRTTAGMGF